MSLSYLILSLVSILSGCLVFIPSLSSKKQIKYLLAFSGSFLLSISLLHILPDIFQGEGENLGIYLMLGFFLQLILDYFSGGIEHGHTHVNHSKLGNFPFLIFFSLCLHAFLEAIPLNHFDNQEHNHSLLIGLIVHKAPISFILASLLLAYKLPKSRILIGIFIFSLTAPLGAWIGTELFTDIHLFKKALALSAGIILHLSTTILLEGNEEHTIQWKKLIPMILGAILASLTLI